MTKRRRSQDRISDLPEESVNGISDLPEESVNGISNLPEESANEISNLPEESVNGISNLPEESVNGISNLPEESVNEISNLPEESVNRISNSQVDGISNLPVKGISNSPVNRVSNSPLDRISNLPTDIIREIQSYLPWKVGAKFNILSKIWRRIWASHPRIILDEMDFGADYSKYRVSDKAKRVAFLSYLIKLLESRKRPSEYDCDIDKFFLRMTTLEDSPPPKNLVIINPKYVTHILPVTNMEHLELEIISRHGTFEEVTDELISILPDLKTLSLTLGYTTKFFQFSRADNVLSAKEVPNPNLIRF